MNKISRIIVKYLTFGTNDVETHDLEQWRKEKSQHEELFRKVISHDFLENALDPKHEALFEREWKKIEGKTLRVSRKRHLLRVVEWAAVVVFIISVGTYYYMSNNEKKEIKPEMAYSPAQKSKAIISLAGGEQITVYQDTVFQKNVGNIFIENRKDTISFTSDNIQEIASDKVHRIEVPRGGEYVARLEDGTIVHMDAASTLIVPQAFKKDIREVQLIGHAYFTVTKDSSRPFVVKSGNVSVRVLGTEFDFKAYEDQEMTTTLVKGLVEISNSRSKFKLNPSQQARVCQDGRIEVQNVDIYPFIAWKEERIVFRNEPLISIMKVLERWYDVQSTFLSEEIKQETFTIDIEKYADIGKVLTVMEKTNKVSIEVKGSKIFIRKK